MRKAAGVCRGIMWVLFVVILSMQILAIVSIEMNNQMASQIDAPDKMFSVIPLLLASVLLLAGILLFTIYRKRPYIGLILCAVAGVLFVILALEIQRQFPPSLGADGETIGITTARMIFRHMSPAVIPVLMLAAWLMERSVRRNAPVSAATDKTGFDLSGAPLFHDEPDSGNHAVAQPKPVLASSQKRSGRRIRS